MTAGQPSTESLVIAAAIGVAVFCMGAPFLRRSLRLEPYPMARVDAFVGGSCVAWGAILVTTAMSRLLA